MRKDKGRHRENLRELSERKSIEIIDSKCCKHHIHMVANFLQIRKRETKKHTQALCLLKTKHFKKTGYPDTHVFDTQSTTVENCSILKPFAMRYLVKLRRQPQNLKTMLLWGLQMQRHPTT